MNALLRFLKRIVLMALNLSLSRLSLGGGGAGIPSLTMTGAVSDSLGSAVAPGNHASISVGFPSGVTAWSSQAWGTSYGDSTYGTGASPTDYTAGDGGNLYWEGLGDDGNTYRSIAGIRPAAGTASAIAGGQTWVVDDTSVNINAAASGANLTFSYAITGVPSQITINSSSGAITGTVTYAVGGATGSGTATITATDQYGRTYTGTFTWTYNLRTQATIDGAPDLTFVEDAAISAVDLTVYFVTNGNTLTYTAVDTLPTGLSLSTAGSLTGTPTTITADANYTTRGTDEYGRATDLEVPIEITGAPIIAFASFTEGTDTGALTTTSPSDGNWHWATVTDGGTAPTADGAGGWTGTILESGTVAVGASGADVEFNTTSSTGDGARDLYVYQRTAGGTDSAVIMQDFIADNTAPTLSSVSTTPGNTTAALDWSTNEANGDAYWVLTTSATVPSVANIIAGNDHTGSAATDSGTAAVSATGAQPQISSTSLTNGNTYYYHLVHRDDHRNDSSVSTTSVTPAAAGITIVGWTQATGANPSTGPALDLTSLDAAGSATGTGDGGTLAENDVVFIWSSTCSNTARTNNVTGYTFLPGDDVLHGQDLSFRAMYKVMGATPDTTAQAAYNGDSNAAHILIGVAVRGLDTTTPIDATATEAEAPSGSSVVNPPSATPVTTGANLLVFGSSTDGDSHDISVNADITLIGKVSNLGTGRFVIGAVGIKDDWTSGAFDPGVWTSDNTDSGDECWGAVTVPIRPA